MAAVPRRSGSAPLTAKFGAREAARLEAVYASPAIAFQRARMRAALGARPGQRGLDVGCGPAFLYGIARDEAEAWKVDLLARASGGEYLFSLMRYLFVATRPGG